MNHPSGMNLWQVEYSTCHNHDMRGAAATQKKSGHIATGGDSIKDIKQNLEFVYGKDVTVCIISAHYLGTLL